MKDWMFATENMTSNFRRILNPSGDSNIWFVCAFKDNKHYIFNPPKNISPEKPAKQYLCYIIAEFASILYDIKTEYMNIELVPL